MSKFFTLVAFVFLQVIYVNQVKGQGCYAGCNFNVGNVTAQYPSSTIYGNGTGVLSTVNSCTYAGHYQVYHVQTGYYYEWSYWSTDGANTGSDIMALSLFDESGNDLLYNVICSGSQPKIAWTATFTGNVIVLSNNIYIDALDNASCEVNTACHILRWREVAPPENGVLIPTNGSNSMNVNCGTNFTLYDHSGNGVYSSGIDGHTILNNTGSGFINISGPYSTEFSYDYIRIYAGAGITGTLLGSYSNVGNINYTGTAGQTLTVRFTTDESVVSTGFALNVTYTAPSPSSPTSITSNSSVCSGSPITLSVNGSLSSGALWYWYSGSCGGTYIGTGSSISVSPTSTTTYYVRAENACGSVSSCVTKTITVSAAPTVASIAGSSSVCVGSTITLTNSISGGSWSSSNTSKATVNSAGVVTGVSAGSATITYTVTSGGCSTSVTKTITVSAAPTVASIAGSSSVCVGSTITLTNSISGGSWSSSNTSKATVNSAGVVTGVSAGSATITYTVTSGGCSTSVTKTITVSAAPTVASIAGSSSVCVGSTITLTNSISGGSWSSSNTSKATVNSAGVVTGVSAGSATITYTVTSGGCSTSVTKTITVSAAPTVASIAGSSSVCVGSTITLTNSISGGSWSSSNTSKATVNSAGVVTGVSAGSATITYTVTSGGCSTSVTKTITVSAAPTVASIVGSSSVCVGSTITLTNSISGGSWSSSNTSKATVNSAGVVTGVSAGSATITYTVTSSGCSTSVTKTITVSAAPTVASIVGSSSVCVGSTITLTNSISGGSWSSSNTSKATVNSAGVVIGVSAGTVSITYTVTSGGCSTSVTKTITVSTAPTPTISGNTSYCQNSTATLTASGGSSYLWNTSATSASITPSTATTGNYTYTVTVSNASGCSAIVTKTITVNPTPTIYTVSGGGAYCSGGTGLIINLSDSNTGISYQLKKDGAIISGSALSGTGGALSWAGITTAGTYTVVATNPTTGCTATMSGSAIITTATTPTISISPNTNQTICSGQSITFTTSSNVGSCSITWQESPATGTAVWTSIPGATFSTYTVSPSSSKKYRVGYTCGACNVAISTAITVTVNPTPNTYTVTGGGTYCTGGNGVSIGLSGSQSGVTYQLKLNGNNTGLTINGTGSAITFPNQTNQGTYTVVATNTNGCTTTMTGNAIVSVTSNPTVYTLTGGGAYCAGGIGVPIGLSGFQTGVTYVLSRDGVFVSSINSSGGNINFGNQTIAGTYTVVATTNSGGCTAAMSNSVTVSIISVPTQYNITGGGSYCAGSGGVAIGLSDSEVGVTYQLQLNGNNVGTPITGNNNAIGFGNQNNAGTYTVIANNNGCTLAMLGTASVIINSTPTAAISPSGAISVCSGQSTQLTASGGTSYQWSNSLGTSATINPTLSNPTTYTVTVTGANGCTATATKNVTVNTLPTAAISASGATTFCQGSSVNLTATGGNSYAWSSGSNATGITASTAGVYTVTVSNANNCTASVSTSVTVNPLPTTPIINYNGAVAGANIAACDEAALSIATTNGISYQWKKNNNATAVTSANYNTSSSGTFTVQATNNTTGCQSVSNGVNLTIYALPPALLTAEGSTALCPQDSLKLKASPTGSSYTYLWSNGATGSNNWVSDAGTYTVTVTRNYGAISCLAVADAITLTQRPAPTAKATYITQNNTAIFTNQSTEAVSYIWDFGDDTPLITETNPTHTYLSEGYFTVQLTAINTDGCENTSSFGVLIMPLAGNTQSVLFPNPNNGNFTLNLQLAKASVVVVDVFDVTGRLIKRFEFTQTIGLASLNFAIPQLSSGIYLLGVYIDDTTSNYTNFEHGLLANKPLKYNHYRKLLVVD